MLEFRTVSIEDREWICRALRASDYRGCEYSFANNMAWRRQNDSRIARFQDYYLCCAFDTADGVPSFIWPSGTGDADALLDANPRGVASGEGRIAFAGVVGEACVFR